MTSQEQFQTYFPPNVEVLVTDYTLALSEIDEFSQGYGPRTGGEVRIISRWGGPAAGGPGWGGPEIAVAIVLGEMLRRGSSDAYNLVRSLIIRVYSKIRTRTGARLYIDGAMAIGVDSETKPLRILFCFPERLSASELEARLQLVEKHWGEVLKRFEQSALAESNNEHNRTEVKVCWDEVRQTWDECQPVPASTPDQ